jgi:hypothetical protein
MPPVRGRVLKYTEDDEHILRRLGAALVVQWDELPGNLRQLLIDQATNMSDRHSTVQLRQQIETFIEKRDYS